MSKNRWAVVAAVGVAGALAFTARVPGAGGEWRVAFVTLSLGATAGLYIALRSWRPSMRTVWAGAVVARLVLVPLPPTLSDDGYRYVWDGVVQVQAGVSPYRWRPADPALAEYHDDEIFGRLNSPAYYSVYPPVSQAVFALGALAYPLGWHVSWLVVKAVTVLTELVGVWALLRLVAPHRAALYAWHPLAVVEVAGQGHTEGVWIGCLGLALLALRHRQSWSGTWLTVGGWIKLFPFVLVAGAWRRTARAGRLATLVIGATVGVPLVVSGAAEHIRESLRLYIGTFDFYSAPYLVLKAVGYPWMGEPAGQLAATLLSVVGVGTALGAALAADGSEWGVRRAVVIGVIALTLTSSTLHPWHWLGLLFVIPLLQLSFLALLASTSTATYLTYIWPSSLYMVTWLGWGGSLLLLVWSKRSRMLSVVMQARARRKAQRVVPLLRTLRPGGRVLDLGAGEGYVGREVAVRLGLGVTALDVVQYGVAAPIEVYDGQTVPYPSDYFDATLLIFVLHHAVDPLGLLREAVRVTRGPVIVLETVWTSAQPKSRLEWIDRQLNRLRSFGSIDEAPLNIRRDAEWRQVFAAEGCVLQHACTSDGLHPQALYVLDGQGTRAKTSAGVAVRASSHVASS